MKKNNKIAVLLISAAMVMSMTACGQSSGTSSSASGSTSSATSDTQSAVSVADITKKIQEEVKFASMAEVKSDRLAEFYDVKAEDIDEMSIYICGSGAFPDEIAVFKMKSSDKLADVKKAMEARLDKLTTTYKDYTPDEMYKVEGAKISESGNYIALIVSADNDKAESTFKEMAK